MPDRDAVPVHVHGSSKYYYRLGCTHELCKKIATEKRNSAPSRRRESSRKPATP